MANEAQISGIAGRYALAVFDLALEEKSLDVVSRDFAALQTMISESADLARLVRAPVFSRDEQRKGMAALLQKMGAAPLTTRFVLMLAAKRRLFLLTGAIRAYEAMVAKQHGEIAADVVSARALNTKETDELKQALKSKLGREPQLTARVDPALLGGLIVKIGSRMIDSSLRTKLNGLRVAMRGR